MGFFSDVTGIGSSSGSDAAKIQQEFNQKAIDELKRQFGITEDNVNPFIDAGKSQIPSVTQGTTAGGLDARLAEIFNTDTFGSLVDERTRSAQGQLSAGGLTRSGTALQEISNIPAELGLAIEQLLTGRSTAQANQGLQAGLGLGSLGQNNAGQIANLFGNSGRVGSQGALLDDQTNAAGIQQLIGLGAGAAGGAFQAGGGANAFFSGGMGPQTQGQSMAAGALKGLFFGGK